MQHLFLISYIATALFLSAPTMAQDNWTRGQVEYLNYHTPYYQELLQRWIEKTKFDPTFAVDEIGVRDVSGEDVKRFNSPNFNSYQAAAGHLNKIQQNISAFACELYAGLMNNPPEWMFLQPGNGMDVGDRFFRKDGTPSDIEGWPYFVYSNRLKSVECNQSVIENVSIISNTEINPGDNPELVHPLFYWTLELITPITTEQTLSIFIIAKNLNQSNEYSDNNHFFIDARQYQIHRFHTDENGVGEYEAVEVKDWYDWLFSDRFRDQFLNSEEKYLYN